MRAARAGRPVYAGVTTVSCSRSACLHAGDAPDSGQKRNAVPSCTASAPSASAAAIPSPSMIPPAAITGMDTAAGHRRHELRERHETGLERVEERAAVPSGLGALRDDRVDPVELVLARLLDRRRGPDHGDADVVERLRVDEPEGGAEHRHALLEHDGDLVVEAPRQSSRLARLAVAGDECAHGVDRLRLRLLRRQRREQVHGERRRRQLPDRPDRRAQLVRRSQRGAEGAERARLRHRGDELRRRHVRHRRLHEREPKAEPLGQGRVEPPHSHQAATSL